MFDLFSFIRQALPPYKRTDILIGLCQVLFGPVLSLFTAVAHTRDTLTIAAQRRGQTLVLEDLLNQAAYGTGIGAVYILDATTPDLDFEVIVPGTVDPSVIGAMGQVLAHHALLGKRYAISSTPTYTATTGVTAPLAFSADSPSLNNTTLFWSINKTGQYRTVITVDGTVVIDTDYLYVAGIPSFLTLSGTAFRIDIGGVITATVTRGATVVSINHVYYVHNVGTVNGMAYDNLSIYVDGVTLGDTMNATLQGLNGTVVKSTPSVKVMDAPTGGITQPGLFAQATYQCLFPSDGYGTFRLTIQVGTSSVKKMYDVTIDSTHPQAELTAGVNPANVLTTTPTTPPVIVDGLPNYGFSVTGIQSTDTSVLNFGVNYRTINGITYGYLTNSATYTPPSGNIAQYYIDGVAVSALDIPARNYPIGTDVTIDMLVGPTPTDAGTAVIKSEQQLIIIGNP